MYMGASISSPAASTSFNRRGPDMLVWKLNAYYSPSFSGMGQNVIVSWLFRYYDYLCIVPRGNDRRLT